MISVELLPDLGLEISPQAIERAARLALDLSGAADADLTVALTVDQRLHDLNLEFLGIDAPTDVLSFTAAELNPETGRLYLGDVIISVPQAARQAAERGHSTEAELQLLTVHGVLHLLGHDHASPEEKVKMWSVQSAALKELNLPDSVVHE